MAEADDKTRLLGMIDRMRADGAGDEQIRSFVMMARQASAEKASRTAGTPMLNPRTGMRLDTSPDEVGPGDLQADAPQRSADDSPAGMMHEGLARMSPEEKHRRNIELAASGAAAVTGPALGALFGAGLGAGAGLAARAGAAALTATGAGEAAGATRGLMEGKRGADVLDSAAEEGAPAALIGIGGHLAGEGAGTVASKLINSKSWVGRYLRAKAAGTYDTPEMKALPEGAAGVNEAANQAHTRISNKLQANRTERGQTYAASLNPPGPKPGAPLSREQAILESAPSRPDQDALLAAAKGVDAPPVTPPTAREQLLAAARGVDAPQPATRPAPGGYEPAASPPEDWPAEGLRRPVDREALIANLRAQQVKNVSPDTGMPYDKTVHRLFDEAIADLGPEGTTNTVEGVLGQRRAIGKRANFGSPMASPDDLATQDVYGGYRQAVREAAPDVGAADDVFAGGARKDARARDIVYKNDAEVLLPEGTKPPGPQSELADELAAPKDASPEAQKMAVLKEQQGVRNLERIGDTESKPGREYQRYLQELADQDPEFAKALDFIGAKSGYEATRFGLHSHMPTHLGKATAPWLRLGMQNLDAGLARGLHPVADAAGSLRLSAPFSGTVADRLLHAKEGDKEQRRKRADTVRSGGHE